MRKCKYKRGGRYSIAQRKKHRQQFCRRRRLFCMRPLRNNWSWRFGIFAQALALLKRRAAQIFDALPLVKFNILWCAPEGLINFYHSGYTTLLQFILTHTYTLAVFKSWYKFWKFTAARTYAGSFPPSQFSRKYAPKSKLFRAQVEIHIEVVTLADNENAMLWLR